VSLTFYGYPNCGSCKKAQKWLEENNVDYHFIHIVENTPTKEEILTLMKQSDEKPRRFFNTSGRVYRELNMKDKVQDLTNDEMAEYLTSDGMLIRRPIVTDGQNVTIGFKEEQFAKNWL